MRILAIDVGTGTQDILAFDTSILPANCPKMVMPSPTSTLANKISLATSRRTPLLFEGYTMGGGPSTWALKQHLKAGIAACATPDAARTFDDDLEELRQLGVVLISADEAPGARGVERLQLKDADLPAIESALSAFGVSADFDIIAVAVQDHGAAPKGVSDRTFRFEHLKRRLAERDDLLAFAYLLHEVPEYLTRMVGVARSLAGKRALIMDTGFACVLGAQEDRNVSRLRDRVIVNLGNSHTIAFHLHQERIMGMFEHHTGEMRPRSLRTALQGLTGGSLTNEEVFASGGHGAVVVSGHARSHFVAAVGPRRDKLAFLRPYFAVPHGDMMVAGCFGLVRACAQRFPEFREEIEGALAGRPTAFPCIH